LEAISGSDEASFIEQVLESGEHEGWQKLQGRCDAQSSKGLCICQEWAVKMFKDPLEKERIERRERESRESKPTTQ
jgi:hypothetical protein